MKYSLYLASAGDDNHTAYSYVISNFEGVKAGGVFIALGDRRNDESYAGNIALQRALRVAARLDGVITLHINFDLSVVNPLAFEVMEIEPPLYPALSRGTQRLLKRFSAYEIGSGEYGDDDASPFEAMALDEALDALEQARTIKGRWQLLCDRFFNPQKIIR